jgi:hypothetical protein
MRKQNDRDTLLETDFAQLGDERAHLGASIFVACEQVRSGVEHYKSGLMLLDSALHGFEELGRQYQAVAALRSSEDRIFARQIEEQQFGKALNPRFDPREAAMQLVNFILG